MSKAKASQRTHKLELQKRSSRATLFCFRVRLALRAIPALPVRNFRAAIQRASAAIRVRAFNARNVADAIAIVDVVIAVDVPTVDAAAIAADAGVLSPAEAAVAHLATAAINAAIRVDTVMATDTLRNAGRN
jgi:hypothetical protein